MLGNYYGTKILPYGNSENTHSGNSATAPVPKQTQLLTFSIEVAGKTCFHQCLQNSKIKMRGCFFSIRLVNNL